MSAGNNPGARKPTVSTSALGANTTSVALPLSFMLVGLLALCLGTGWILFRPSLLAAYHYNQHVIALTHLMVLGWMASVVMGAMYQLVPVALETKLYSEKLVRWHLACHLIGCAGMVWMFRSWNLKQVGHFGGVLVLGIGLFFYNLARTLRRVPRWNVTATAVASALLWISCTALAGLCIVAGKSVNDLESGSSAAGLSQPLLWVLHGVGRLMARFDPMSAMHAHAHLGVVGFFTMLIVGVSYKLIPMFTLSEVQSQGRATASIVLLNLGLAGSLFTILFRSQWKPVFALVGLIALLLYGRELVAILRARKRSGFDWGIRYFLTAISLLLPLSMLSVVLSWPSLPLNRLTGQLETLYGFVGLVGVVSFAIVGMLYKIIPFLVWYGRYSPHIGKAKVPSLADLYSGQLQAIGYWAFLLGLALTGVALILGSEPGVRVGSAALLVSISTLVANTVLMLRHLVWPKIEPLAKPSNSPKNSAKAARSEPQPGSSQLTISAVSKPA
jgi:hypothetical protein